jgi:mono/diheme cytochrome c family protein
MIDRLAADQPGAGLGKAVWTDRSYPVAHSQGATMKPACPLVAAILATALSDVGAQASDSLGRTEYDIQCAACHGVSGRGDGPQSRELKLPIPDLGTLAQRHGGNFPADHVRRVIDGRQDIKGHAGRQMPLWGQRYARAGAASEATVQQRIDALSDYLRTLQR